ncbi:MAG: alginate lyase family protein [Elusimicrobia bacterium]|nr:alginate lyase family protein [Elusimicrobiota bacterium]
MGSGIYKLISAKTGKAVRESKRLLFRMNPHLFGAHITDEKFIKSGFKAGLDLDNMESVGRYFRSSARTSVKNIQGKNIELPPEITDCVTADADKVVRHDFRILGKEYNLPGEIDWHKDHNSGYRWEPGKYYFDIEYGNIRGTDVKVPWELSRFQHLAVLGQAYAVNGDERYAEEFMSQVGSWIRENPAGYGVNWRCTMDTAIRAVNWLNAYYYFSRSGRLTHEFAALFVKSCLEHGRFIMNNLERRAGGVNSNHYIADLAGLIFLGTLLPELKEAGKWKDFGVNELKKEIIKQVYEDGCDFEASTCYHRLVLEIFFFSMLICVINHADYDGKNHVCLAENIFGKKYMACTRNMFEAVMYLLKPNGNMPQIGDNDSGQLLRFYARDVLDMRYLLSLGAVFFREERWKIREYFRASLDISEIFLVYGNEGINIWNSLSWNLLENIGSRNFCDAGWYVMRSKKNYCLISCGPNGQSGNGGHAHNDKLSFELCVNGKDLLVDPGSYVYTPEPEQRNRFRGTEYHNTVMIDNEEQNRIDSKYLFKMSDDSMAKCLNWESKSAEDIFEGKHKGFCRLNGPVEHRRKIRLDRQNGHLYISDVFEGSGRHKLQWSFVRPPESPGKGLKIVTALALREDKIEYSGEYGAKVITGRYFAEVESELPYEAHFDMCAGADI